MEEQCQITTIDFLRHGQCEGGDVYRGSLDVELDKVGWEQMRAAAAGGKWQRIISSPLQRCAAFAAELADHRSVPLHLQDAFRELHFGDWEGREIAGVWAEQGVQAMQFFVDIRAISPPNGEKLSDFKQRVVAGWNALLARHSGEHVLLVAHGGTLRILLAEVLGMPLERIATLDVPYACISRVRVYRHENHADFAMLTFHNRGVFHEDAQL